MRATLEIRRASDGAVRTHPTSWAFDLPDDNGFSGEFIWSEGNFACDCNRRDFFAVAGGEDHSEETECGDGAYDVRLTGPDGVILYQDGDNWPDTPS